MKSEDILIELDKIMSNNIVTKNDLMIILKKYALLTGQTSKESIFFTILFYCL